VRTLYVRIVATFVGIAFVSGIVGLALTGVYYQERMKSESETKAWEMAQSIRELYEQGMQSSLDQYLAAVAKLGFQIYAVDERLEGKTFGRAFKHGTLDDSAIRLVLDGGVFHGMEEENGRVRLFALFENSVRNTVGIPVRTPEGGYAVFVRPDLEAQIGEVRIVSAVLIGLTFLASLVLIAVLSRYIVKPLNVLKEATRRIARGDFNVELEKSRSRKDEIGDLAEHFALMADSIGRLDRMRRDFVANVSHEFQTPLTSMQGLAKAMRDQQTTPEQTEQYLGIIERESRRLSSLSRQLLKLASLDRDDVRLQKESFRLDEQIREALITLEWQWSEKELNLELELPETFVTADAHLLHEVWMNLLSNGIRFCEPGDTIAVSIREERGNQVAVEIRDTGCGIPEEDLPLIFDRFHKADKSRSRSSENGGSGLGLSIAGKIVALHGGTIAVESELGRGTTFTVRLPQL